MVAMGVMMLGGLGGDPITYNLGLSDESARLAASCPAWMGYLTELFGTPTAGSDGTPQPLDRRHPSIARVRPIESGLAQRAHNP